MTIIIQCVQYQLVEQLNITSSVNITQLPQQTQRNRAMHPSLLFSGSTSQRNFVADPEVQFYSLTGNSCATISGTKHFLCSCWIDSGQLLNFFISSYG